MERASIGIVISCWTMAFFRGLFAGGLESRSSGIGSFLFLFMMVVVSLKDAMG